MGNRRIRRRSAQRTIRSAIETLEPLERRVLLAANLSPSVLTERFLFKAGRTLSAAAAGSPLHIALSYLSAHAASLGVLSTDVANPIVTDQYTDHDTGITHLYLQQRVNHLPVDNTSINVNITRDGSILSIGGAFVADAARKVAALPKTAGIIGRTAIQGLKTLGLNVPADSEISSSAAEGSSQFNVPKLSLDPIRPVLHYVATAAGGLAAAWQLIVRTPDRQHWYDTHVDANSGKLIYSNDWVDSASYDVYPAPIEAPNDGPGGSVPRSIVTNPSDPNASPYGWHDTNGVAGAEFTDTRGNNVSAQEDTDANNSGGFRPDAGASLNFDYPIDFAQPPSVYQSAAITNLFYWNNLLHDIHYHYGFDEAAGNFQVKNYSGLGLGNDAVQADAQDGSGTNNANFATPPDGTAPRMQMYLFNYTSPGRDGDLDNEIITHEFGHGVSNRLTGGPANSNALDATQSGGMGEGWSDWWALMFTQDPTDTKTSAYPQGTYVLGQTASGAGIRRKPYSFDMSIDTLTVDAYGTSGTGGGVSRSTEVHDSGEIWATTLWDLNWLLIDKYGYSPTISQGYDPAVPGKNGGNNLALQLVMDGLKLQPANPSFLQARDAILLADQVRTGGANAYQIWQAFARRGMGYSFVDSSSSATTVTPAYDIPPGLQNPSVVSQSPSGVLVTPPTAIDLTFSKAMDPTSFSLASDVNSFTGPGGVNLAGQLTGFSWTNSNQTLHLTFTPQTLNGLYTLNIGPQILGASDGHAMDQNSNGIYGEAGDSYSATFRFDALAGQVTSTVPANGTLASVPLTSIDFNFNEPYAPSSVTASDLTVSQGTVTGVSVVDSDTVRFNLSGVNSEGTLNLSIAAGAITDVDGNPMASYSGSLALDATTIPFPTPLTRRGALGMQIYDGSANASIGAPGDTDGFTLNLDAGQVITLTVVGAAALQPTIQAFDPLSNLLGSATASAVGKSVVLQTVPVTTAGTYTFKVGGASGSSGAYTVGATLNAAQSQGLFGGSNQSLATAQDLNGSFVGLGNGASHAAVMGGAVSTGGALATNFESGLGGFVINNTLGTMWHLSTGRGTQGGHSSTHSLYFGQGETDAGGGNYDTGSRVAGTVTSPSIALPAGSAPNLNFNYVLQTEGSTSWDSALVQVSTNGGASWTTLVNLTAVAESTTWRSATPISLAAYAGQTVMLQFSFDTFDGGANNYEGWYIDDVSVSNVSTVQDYYSFSMAAGDSAALALKGTIAGDNFSILDAGGNVLASSTTGFSNVDRAIASFTAPSSGTYYVSFQHSGIRSLEFT